MAGINLEEAIDKQRIFHNYLLEHRIFSDRQPPQEVWYSH